MSRQKTMTYGVMPSWADFIKHYDDEMEGDRFRIHLKGSDARTASSYGLDTEVALTARETYDYINVLAMAVQEEGDENAGSIASGMLGILHFEWV